MTERRSLSTYSSQKTGPKWNVLLFLGKLFNSHCTIYQFNSHEMCDNKIRSRISRHTGFPAFYEFRQPSISSSSQTASLPYVLTFQSSEGTSYQMPSVLLVIPLPIVSCQCVTYITSLYPISFPKTKNKGGQFVHHCHAAADIKSIRGACVGGLHSGCSANDKTRQIKCLLRHTSSAWQDDGGSVMGKREDKERRDQKAKKKNSLSYIYIYIYACAHNMMWHWLPLTFQSMITSIWMCHAWYICVSVQARVCAQSRTDKTDRSISLHQMPAVEQVGSEFNIITMSVPVCSWYGC